jgi:hypothetical protein
VSAHLPWFTVAAGVVVLALPHAAAAQTRLSFGVGGGVAGSTDESLSNGRRGRAFMGQMAHGILPFVGLGVEVDRWQPSGTSVTFATAILQIHIPLTGLLLKAGAGYGSGDPDGRGKVSGAAGQLGVAYDLTIPAAPIAFTVFGTASMAHAAARSVQLENGGIAITLR